MRVIRIETKYHMDIHSHAVYYCSYHLAMRLSGLHAQHCVLRNHVPIVWLW